MHEFKSNYRLYCFNVYIETGKLPNMILQSEIAAVVLAGGKSSRMGYQDKALLTLHKKPLIEHVIENARNQVGSMVISVNNCPQKYEYLQLPLIPDKLCNQAGPLSGIYSAMDWFHKEKKESDIKYLACFAADVPYFPENIIALLSDSLESTGCKVAYCISGGQIQPLFSLWSLDLLDDIKAALNRGVYGPKPLLPKLQSVMVDIPSSKPEYFLNINSPDSLAEAEKRSA
ncbi:MAG: molybdenum cofactor guanylyltransferase [SAR86 cluster bacterium]|uniref:Molybdenum cofactor guanylyltransferase n=1 Tax=SAR86 cluster bacterium TaxID=2030880 RepID=A0A2A5BA15_9GAMM|nr:MAG: molybdenum cofactor guanylyltransferase [SAR86 cluster bacterium]